MNLKRLRSWDLSIIVLAVTEELNLEDSGNLNLKETKINFLFATVLILASKLEGYLVEGDNLNFKPELCLGRKGWVNF